MFLTISTWVLCRVFEKKFIRLFLSVLKSKKISNEIVEESIEICWGNHMNKEENNLILLHIHNEWSSAYSDCQLNNGLFLMIDGFEKLIVLKQTKMQKTVFEILAETNHVQVEIFVSFYQTIYRQDQFNADIFRQILNYLNQQSFLMCYFKMSLFYENIFKVNFTDYFEFDLTKVENKY